MTELVAGVDEVGRGPLIGSVVAAACILPAGFQLAGLTDSKKISEKKRIILDQEIRQQSLAWCIAEASAAEVDELNVLQASLLAMKRAVDGLAMAPEFVLVDGNKLPEWHYPSKAIVGGDGVEPAISAASILAKVFRDQQMISLGQQYPDYGFEKHKGYPTKQHIEAIQAFGVLDEHRRSFGPVKKLLGL
ncbi:MAG: ribonuclease HII [Arenicella sp.]